MGAEDISVEFWISTVFQALALLFVGIPLVWKLLIQPVITQINGLGERVNKVEVNCNAHNAEVQHLKGEMQVAIFDRQHIHENLSALEERFQRFLDNAELDRRTMGKDEREILDRLASIEAKVDVGASLKEAFLAISRGGINDTR